MGYVNDTHMSQYIPSTAMHGVTGTYTHAAGAVTGTIAYHRAAAASTGVINIPIMLPSNSSAQKGAYLKSVEVDYELLVAAATSVTFSMNKVTRGADLAVAVVAAVTVTQSLGASAGAETAAMVSAQAREVFFMASSLYRVRHETRKHRPLQVLLR